MENDGGKRAAARRNQQVSRNAVTAGAGIVEFDQPHFVAHVHVSLAHFQPGMAVIVKARQQVRIRRLRRLGILFRLRRSSGQ